MLASREIPFGLGKRGHHMPASRKKITEHEATFGPRPLPPHFGEIDATAPFDPHRYFTMLRCVGANPYLWRHDEQGVMFCQSWHGSSELHRRRFYEAVAWANAKDKGNKSTNLFPSEIAKSKGAGNFIHYLG
jgi:hypothetical protein